MKSINFNDKPRIAYNDPRRFSVSKFFSDESHAPRRPTKASLRQKNCRRAIEDILAARQIEKDHAL